MVLPAGRAGELRHAPAGGARPGADSVSAGVLALAAGAELAEHAHSGQTELWYMLAGNATLTVAGTQVALTPTSVVQIPRNTRHAVVATSELRAVQIFTPAVPAHRAKAQP